MDVDKNVLWHFNSDWMQLLWSLAYFYCKSFIMFLVVLGVDGHPMNLYHRALLCLNFQKDFDLSKIDSWIGTRNCGCCGFTVVFCHNLNLSNKV